MGNSLALVVLAGGSGTRTGGADNKVYRSVGGRPILSYPLEVASLCGRVSRLIVVTRPTDRAIAESIIEEYAPSLDQIIVEGGPSRHQSEWNAIGELAIDIESGALGLVAVHDGARPFMTLALFDALIEAAEARGGSIPGLPLDGVVVSTAGSSVVDHDRLRRVQTPQIFRAPPLLAAYRLAKESGFEGLDTSETVRRFTDTEVVSVPGDERNLKITFSPDFETAESLADRWLNGRWRDRSV